MKHCSKCKQSKLLGDFYRDRSKRDGLASVCRACASVAGVAQRAKADKVALAVRSRESSLMRKYGITTEQWNAAFFAQDGSCAICKSRNPRHQTGFKTDHRHDGTVNFRGILCHPCNRALGDYELGWRPGDPIAEFEAYLAAKLA